MNPKPEPEPTPAPKPPAKRRKRGGSPVDAVRDAIIAADAAIEAGEAGHEVTDGDDPPRTYSAWGEAQETPDVVMFRHKNWYIIRDENGNVVRALLRKKRTYVHLSNEQKDRYVQLLKDGCGLTLAAEYAGLRTDVVRAARREDADFNRQCIDAYKIPVETCSLRVYDKAVNEGNLSAAVKFWEMRKRDAAELEMLRQKRRELDFREREAASRTRALDSVTGSGGVPRDAFECLNSEEFNMFSLIQDKISTGEQLSDSEYAAMGRLVAKIGSAQRREGLKRIEQLGRTGDEYGNVD